MALTVTFNDANKTTLPYIAAYEEPIFFDGVNRRQLRFEFAPDVISLDSLNDLLSNEDNLSVLQLHNDGEPFNGMPKQNPSTNIHDNYSIKVKCSMEPTTTSIDEETHAEIREDRIIVVLARLTPNEIAVKKQNLQILEMQRMMAAILNVPAIAASPEVEAIVAETAHAEEIPESPANSEQETVPEQDAEPAETVSAESADPAQSTVSAKSKKS